MAKKRKPSKRATPQTQPLQPVDAAKLSLPDHSPEVPEFTEITEPKKRRFLQALCRSPRIGEACRLAGITGKTGWNWRHDLSDVAFQAALAVATEVGLQMAEDELFRRGVHGVKVPVWYKGRLVGTELEYDTTAAIFMLKGAMPEKYRERYEHSGSGGGPIKVDVRPLRDLTTEQLEARISALLAELRTGPPVVIDVTPVPKAVGGNGHAVEPANELELAYAASLATRKGGA